jgi:hypothetical protein
MHGSDLGEKCRNFMLIAYSVSRASLAKLFETHAFRNGKLTVMVREKLFYSF